MKRLIISFFVCFGMVLTVSAAFERVNPYGEFSDVNKTAWYYDNVKTAYELGFMNGKAEGKFDPDGTVTIAEGITMASRLHAIYNGLEISSPKIQDKEYRIDFDDPSVFVDLSARNSRLDKGVGLFRAEGGVENGMLVLQSNEINSHGSYDPGVFVSGLGLDTRFYNLIKVRMKRDALPNPNNAPRNERLEVFFETSSAGSITGDKSVTYDISKISDLSEWFEVEIDMSKHKLYTDTLVGIRFDTTNNNGRYYIDYIAFSSNGKSGGEKWYDKYVDYAEQNNIVKKDKYQIKDMDKSITRSELCRLFASALPEEYFAPINDIKGIPDVDRHEDNSEVYLALYKAGVLSGSDKDGSFMGDSYIKRSEASAIINRTALPEARVKAEFSHDWEDLATLTDIEFDDENLLQTLKIGDAENYHIKDGSITLSAKQRENGRYDTKITFNATAFNAHDYSKMRVRMKAENVDTSLNTNYDFYFMTEGDGNFSESKSYHGDFLKSAFVDCFGWYVFDIDLRLVPSWEGKITSFRFDPSNSGGTYTIDYIRFIEDEDYFKLNTHEELINAGYTATRLLRDEGFETGFEVSRVKNTATSMTKGSFQDYVEDKSVKPMWNISPHWARFDLVDDRDTTADKYTLKDKHDVNTITYNPDEKSVTMRVNTYPIYEGKPHIPDEYEWWPHLLISQDSGQTVVDRDRNSAAADRVFIEIDIRILDFKDTTIKEGTTSANFMTYFYLRTDKSPGDLIWFGLNFFNGTRVDDTTKCGWAPDSAAHQYMYKISQALVFDGVENSFVPEKGTVLTGEEWKHVRIDVTPHIEQAVKWANRDNAFGTPVTVEDMFFEGVNIGFETWGNYDYTVEFKNFNMVSYNKSE